MPDTTLPVTAPNWRFWSDQAPDPEIQPEFYEGVVLRRSVAYLIDLVIIGAMLVVVWVLGILFGIASFGLLMPLVAPLVAVVPLAYHTWLIGGPSSATVGMQIMGVEVRTWDGRRPGYVQAALQTVVFYTSVALTSWLILLVALFNPRRRCLHDFLCGTIVIRSRPAVRASR